MKLINTSQSTDLPPVLPVEVPALVQTGPEPVTDYHVTVIADHPSAAPVVWALPLTWKLSNLPKPDISMNDGIRAWVNYSTAFSNWLYTCLTVFVSLDQDDITLHIPDQFIADLDVRVIVMVREYDKGGKQKIRIMV